MNVRFCESCRSLVLADFRFCPYCGQSAPRGPGLEEALAAPFERIDRAIGRGSARGGASGGATGGASGEARFDELELAIARLEADMDLIISQLETEIGISST